ncbi:hypothetical protein ACFVUS_12360 [Nocardia sp. NPDC058058]|uniref:hypothetical protein n=1 Tax=Nocardia sp. NPDC058058 TaxID=3346317 RepID=UPI0036DBAB0F
MTYAELVHTQAENCVRATFEYHGAFNQKQFRVHFETLVDFAYRDEFAAAIKAEERHSSMIALLFAFEGAKK